DAWFKADRVRRRAGQRRHRPSGLPGTCRPGDQGSQVLSARWLEITFGEVLPERVLEAVGCDRSSTRCGRGGAAAGAADEVGCRGSSVLRVATVGDRQVLVQEPGSSARPEQQTDDEADGAANRDVLDPDQPDLPARRLDQVEGHEQYDSESELPRDHWEHLWRV